MELMDAIRIRKSVRNFMKKPVEEEKIKLILEAARLAPSFRNMQCWEFVVIQDKTVLNRISNEAFGLNKWLHNAPLFIVACADPKESGTKNGMDYYLVDTAIALEHLVLAATDQGLGTCWLADFDEKKLKDILLIPTNFKAVAIVSIGYAAEKQDFKEKILKFVIQSKKRKPTQEFVHYNKW